MIALLFPPPTAELSARRPVPDRRQVHREIKRGRHFTLRLVWLEWRQDDPDGWGCSQFCARYSRWLGAQGVVMRLSYAAGRRRVERDRSEELPPPRCPLRGTMLGPGGQR